MQTKSNAVSQFFSTIPVEEKDVAQTKPRAAQGPVAILTMSDEGLSIEVFGGDGVNCKKLTEDIEKGMGGATEREMKPEVKAVPDKKPGTASLGARLQI